MAGITNNLIDQIKELARRIRSLELSVFTYGEQPDTPPSEAAITNLTSSVTYYTEPTTLIPRASVTFNWTKPNTPDDPVVSYYVSVTRTGDSGTGGYVNVGDVNSYVVSGLPVDTNVTFRIYGMTRSGVLGPVATHARTITKLTTAPPQPSTPTVESALRGVRVANDGKSNTGGAMPADLSYYEVHAANNGTVTFTPTATTLWGKMGPNESVYITANSSYQNIAVRLIAVNTSGVKSTPSTGVIGTPSKVNDTDSGIVLPSGTAYSNQGNLVVDGSFESSKIRTLRNTSMNAAWSWANDTGGAQHGTWFLKATNTVGTGNRDVYLTSAVQGTSPIDEFIIQPDNKYYVTFRARNIGAVGNMTFMTRARKGDGTYTYPSLTVTPAMASTGDWEQFSFVITPPDGAVSMRVYIRTVGTAGEWHVDAVEIRQIISTVLIEDGAITRAKIGLAEITSAHIEEVDAGLVKSGFLDSDRLQSKSIKTRHFEAGAVTFDILPLDLGEKVNLDKNTAVTAKADQSGVDELTNTVNTINSSVDALSNAVKIDAAGITITNVASSGSIKLNSNGLELYEGNARAAYINSSTMYINTAEIVEQIKIGVHIVEKYDATNTFIRWVG